MMTKHVDYGENCPQGETWPAPRRDRASYWVTSAPANPVQPSLPAYC